MSEGKTVDWFDDIVAYVPTCAAFQDAPIIELPTRAREGADDEVDFFSDDNTEFVDNLITVD